MTRLNRILGLVLLLASGSSLAAQSQDATLEKSMVSLIVQISPQRGESSRGLLISDKGLVLTTWRNVCAGTINGSTSMGGKVVGVHPTRDLALVQVEITKLTYPAPKPAKLAASSVRDGDKIFLFQSYQPTPGLVASETQPVGNPEYFWISGRDPKAGAPFPGGWGGSQPRPDDWVTNLEGEVLGVVARVVVNGKMVLRVIPVHDVKPEDFVPPAQKRPNVQRAQELIQMADGLENDRAKNRYRPVPFGSYEPDVQDYLRLAMAEDPTNKDLNFRMGVIRSDSPAGSAPGARGLSDPGPKKTDEQISDAFVRSRFDVALEHLKAGRLKVAQGILEDIVSGYPKTTEAKMAQSLLEKMKDPK